MDLKPIDAPERGLHELALDGFPVIDDFSVTLSEELDEGGRHIEYRSARLGRLAWFPAWDHADRDLPHFIPADVPLGSIDDPYDDRDEGWRILIFKHGDWLYVLEGDAPKATQFATYFRVPADRYFRAWAALIDQFNPITPLDAPDEVAH